MTTTQRIPKWTVQDRMIRAREEAGLTQSQMAERLGTGKATVQRWEKKGAHVKRAALIAWAAVTDVPLWWIEDGEDGDNSRAMAGVNIRELSPVVLPLLTAPVLPYAS